MAQKRKYVAAKDPRKKYPKLRESLRRRVFAMSDECGICHRQVDKTLESGTDLSPELDEIIPVALDGSPYDIENLQLTHRICNRRKGAKLQIVSTDPELSLNPMPTSKSW
jgi:5-methylcytosine-specific restriction endonuclease McrA